MSNSRFRLMTPTMDGKHSFITPALSKRRSFDNDSIRQWSELQESLLVKYSLLSKENETKTERMKILESTVQQYFQTLLRYKELGRSSNFSYNEKQCLLGYDLGMSQTYVQDFILLLMQNQSIFAKIISQAKDAFHDEFIFDILTFIYDPVVGAGLENGIFQFLGSLVQLELDYFSNPFDYFEKSQISIKFVTGFNKRYECQMYSQEILGTSLNLIMSIKEQLELNPRNIYEALQNAKDQRENTKHNKLNRQSEEKKRKNILYKIQSYFKGTQDEEIVKGEVFQSINEHGDFSDIPDELRDIIKEITPAISSLCSTPLGRHIDQQLLEETAQILYDRRQVTQMIIGGLTKSIIQSIHKVPFIIRAVAKLLFQLFAQRYEVLNRVELNNIIINYFINRFISAEFGAQFLNNIPEDMKAYALSNLGVITKTLQGVWRGEKQYGLNIDISYEEISHYLQNLIVLPQTQINYYIKERTERHYQGFMLSLLDLKTIVELTQKAFIEDKDKKTEQTIINLKGLCSQIQKYAKSDGEYLTQQIVTFRNVKCSVLNLHFIINKFSDIFQINFLDTAFKFIDYAKVKEQPKEKQEDFLFLAKAKQVVSQFLISIDRISQISKLRHDVVVTFDNLIYMYKESYESKGGVSIKSYENISPQLYANYLMSIYKMIPEHYISNNLCLLCQEISEEFEKKLQLSIDQQKQVYEVFIKIYTELQIKRKELKSHNKLIKKQELFKKVLNFFKQFKMQCLITFRGGSVQIEKIKDSVKYKNFDPTLQQKQAFIQNINSIDIRELNQEMPFQSIRDFIDIFSGMKLLHNAIEQSDSDSKDIASILFQTYISFCEERMMAINFFQQFSHQINYQEYEYHKKLYLTKISYSDWSVKQQERLKQYQNLCFVHFEKLLTKRILQKYLQSFPFIEDEEFYKKCIQNQDIIPEFQSESMMIYEISQNLKQIDHLITPLDKLECLCQCLENLVQLVKISGIGSGNEGQDFLTPLIINIIRLAGLKQMKQNINIIQVLQNKRWLGQKFDNVFTSMLTAVLDIQQ
ncbi:hypothetical protein pb186bvf_011087 [Paramecium bursaria]